MLRELLCIRAILLRVALFPFAAAGSLLIDGHLIGELVRASPLEAHVVREFVTAQEGARLLKQIVKFSISVIQQDALVAGCYWSGGDWS